LALIRIEGDGFIIWEYNSVRFFYTLANLPRNLSLGHEVFNGCLFYRKGAEAQRREAVGDNEWLKVT